MPDPPHAEDAQAEAKRAARRERLVLERHGDLVDDDDEDEVEEQLEPLDLLREREPARRRARAAVRRVLVEELDVLHVHVVVVELARRRLVLQHGTRLACALQRGGVGAQNRETRGKFLVGKFRSSVKQFCGSGIGAARGWTVSTELLGIGFSSARCRGLDGLVVAENSNVYPGPVLKVHTHGGL